MSDDIATRNGAGHGRSLRWSAHRSAALAIVLAWLAFEVSLPASVAGAQSRGYAGAAVSVVRAKRSCFSETITATGVLVPREDVLVRPDREGFVISSVLVEPGDSVTAGQALARLTPSDPQQGSATVTVTAPAAGIVMKSAAVIGTVASARADPMFHIIARGEFELSAQVPTRQLARMSVGQAAKVHVIGLDELPGRVRTVSSSVDGMTQLGQVRIFIGNNQRLRAGVFGRASIVAGQSCGVAIPLSALLYSPDGAVVAVVRGDRIETRQVTVGLMSQGEVEVREGLAEGDLVAARAGAFLREGDRVRPVVSGAPAARP
jgi:HlyD family secretion protein